MTQKEARRRALKIVLIPLIAYMIPFEYYSWGDSALLLYGICIFFLTLTLTFWFYWWKISIKPPTTMFKIIGMLLSSIEYIMINQFYARWQFVYNRPYYEEFLKGDIWAYRVSPEALIFAWVFCWVVGLLFGDPERKGMMKNGKLKILLIEDDKNMSDMMVQLIASMNAFTIERAFNYKDAIKMFEPDKYVCCIIDLNLGTSTNEGVELATYFRNKDQDVFLAVVSGYFDEIFDQRLLESVDDFVHKPFDISVFKLKVFLWAIKYRRRLRVKQYIEGSDFQVKSEVLQTLDERIQEMYKQTK